MKTPISLDIIIPHYLRIDFLSSVLSNLSKIYQSFKEDILLTIIVVNDSPEEDLNLQAEFDGFAALFSVNFINHTENRGVACARETGLSVANSDWIMFLDQDDELIQESFSVLLDAHKRNVDFVLMNGFLVHQNPPMKFPIYFFEPKLNLNGLIKDDFIRSPGQVFFRRKLIGNFDFPKPNLNKGCDDRFLWILIFLKNPDLKTMYSSKKCYIGNIHATNFGLDSLKLYACSEELWTMLMKHDFGKYLSAVNENRSAIRFILKKDRSMKARLYYLKYKYRLNRIFRFGIKKLSAIFPLYS